MARHEGVIMKDYVDKRVENENLLKEHKKINFQYVDGGETVLCMNCYHTTPTSQMFIPIRSDPTLINMKRYGKCPHCGTQLQEILVYKTYKDRLRERMGENRYNDEIRYIEKVKKTYPCFEKSDESNPDLKFVPGKWFNTIRVFDPKDEITKKSFAMYVKHYLEFRGFYKHLARKKFMYDFFEDANIADEGATKYQYCLKMCNEIIRDVCQNKDFLKYWFMDYTVLLKTLGKLGKKDRANFVFHVLELGKTIEEFEFLNYALAFGGIKYVEGCDFSKFDTEKFMPKYAREGTEAWLNKNRTLVEKFRFTRLGVDSAKDETPVNGGASSYQLSKQMEAEYDKIIAAQRKAAKELEDNKLLQEIEEESKQSYTGLSGLSSLLID